MVLKNRKSEIFGVVSLAMIILEGLRFACTIWFSCKAISPFKTEKETEY